MAAAELCIGLDVGTSGVKAIAVAADGRRGRERRRRVPAADAAPGLDRAGARGLVAGEHRRAAGAAREAAGAGRGARPHRPDAWRGVPRRRRPRDPPGAALERPAHRRRMRSDRAPGRARAAAADRRQPGADRLPGAEDPLAARARAGGLRARAPRAAAQGLHPLPADRARSRATPPMPPARCCSTSPRATGRRSCWARSRSRATGCRASSKGPRSPGGSRPTAPARPASRRACR